jgi:trigger factor
MNIRPSADPAVSPIRVYFTADLIETTFFNITTQVLMSNVVREDIDNTNAVITVKIDKESYTPRFEEELKKYRDKGSFKGFRKGKVPMSFLKKAYGQAVLSEVVNGILQQELYEYISSADVTFLGQPIPSKESEMVTVDVKSMDDYEFKFDIGKAPEFEIKGLGEDNVYKMYDVEIPADTVNEELEMTRRRHGKQDKIEAPVEEQDIVKFEAVELDGDSPKEGGWESSFTILVDRIADEDVKKALIGKKPGEKIQFDINKLEDNQSEDYAKKYFLNMDEETMANTEVGNLFEGTISEITRVQPADLDQEFFDKQFGEGVVSSEEEAKAKIEEDIRKFYDRQAEALLFNDLREQLIEQNKEQIDLPDDFMKRWLVFSDERNTPELVEKDYPSFSDSLRWNLIRNKLVKTFEIEVTPDEIRSGFADRIREYMGGNVDDAILQGTTDRLLQDRQQVERLHDELLDEKMYARVREEVKVEKEPISVEKFGEVVSELRAKQAAIAAAAEEEE